MQYELLCKASNRANANGDLNVEWTLLFSNHKHWHTLLLHGARHTRKGRRKANGEHGVREDGDRECVCVCEGEGGGLHACPTGQLPDSWLRGLGGFAISTTNKRGGG